MSAVVRAAEYITRKAARERKRASRAAWREARRTHTPDLSEMVRLIL